MTGTVINFLRTKRGLVAVARASCLFQAFFFRLLLAFKARAQSWRWRCATGGVRTYTYVLIDRSRQATESGRSQIPLT